MDAITREEKIMTGADLTPITRKELFLAKAAGRDVETPTPITREEMFLSEIGGGTGGGTGNTVVFIVDDKVVSRQVLNAGEAITVPDDPVKENTAQYNISFAGWSADGETVTSVPSVKGKGNLIFTALFTEELRYYTIRFFNESTLLQTSEIPYGELPVYTGDEPTKEASDGVEYMFSGWNPEISTATRDVDYYAQFVEAKSLEDYTWSEISAISADGTGESYFSVGDTKAVTLKGTVGTLELDATYYVYILGFNHNSEVEGNGIHFGTFKSAASNGIDLCLIDSKYGYNDASGAKYFNMNHWGNYNYGGWAGCDMRYDILGSTDKAPSGYGAAKTTSVVGYDPSSTCATSPVADTLMAALPSDLRAVMKPMTKYSNNTGDTGNTETKVTVTTDYLPLLAEFEIFGARTHANSYEQNKQKQYDYYAADNSKVKYRHSATGSAAVWYERSAVYDKSNHFCRVNANGNANSGYSAVANGVAPIFKV